MWTTGITVVLILVAFAVILGWLSERERHKLKLSRFKAREHVPVEELVAAHFADDVGSRDLLVHWWKKAASILEIDATLLRPDDRFDSELAPVAGFLTEDELVDLGELVDDLGLADQFQRQSPQPETFGAYVQFLVHAAAGTAGSASNAHV